MQNILIIIHAAPYGSERCLSALRLATSLANLEVDRPRLRLFLMSDATVAGLPNQNDGTGGSIGAMVAALAANGVSIKLCRTCVQARGLTDLPLLAGVSVGSLADLSQWTLEADKVITF